MFDCVGGVSSSQGFDSPRREQFEGQQFGVFAVLVLLRSFGVRGSVTRCTPIGEEEAKEKYQLLIGYTRLYITLDPPVTTDPDCSIQSPGSCTLAQ